MKTSQVQIWLGEFNHRFLLTLFLLFDLLFIRRVGIFVTRVAKHSNQTFNINTRNNHKGIFSCNRWWCVACYVAVPYRPS